MQNIPFTTPSRCALCTDPTPLFPRVPPLLTVGLPLFLQLSDDEGVEGSHGAKSAVSEVTGLKFKSPGGNTKGGTSTLCRSVLAEDVMEKVGGWLAP